jgi:hypothetical protein
MTHAEQMNYLRKDENSKPKQYPTSEILNDKDRIVRGWITVEARDKDGELIPISEMKKSLNTWMKRGGFIGDQHSNRIIGKALNWREEIHPESQKQGIIMDYQIFDDYSIDDKAWEEIKNGKRQGLSFGGRALNKPTLEKDEGTGQTMRTLTGIESYEVSSVTNPANQFGQNVAINYLAKSERGFSDEEINAVAQKLGYAGDMDEFKKGINVEQEHSDVTGGDLETTAKIAMAHLKEKNDYYTKLEDVEKSTFRIISLPNIKQQVMEVEFPNGSRQVIQLSKSATEQIMKIADDDKMEECDKGGPGSGRKEGPSGEKYQSDPRERRSNASHMSASQSRRIDEEQSTYPKGYPKKSSEEEVEKARHYLHPGEKAPKGASLHQGERGGKYYEDSPKTENKPTDGKKPLSNTIIPEKGIKTGKHNEVHAPNMKQAIQRLKDEGHEVSEGLSYEINSPKNGGGIGLYHIFVSDKKGSKPREDMTADDFKEGSVERGLMDSYKKTINKDPKLKIALKEKGIDVNNLTFGDLDDVDDLSKDPEDEEPFMVRDGGKYHVMYANETKSKEFNDKDSAKKFMRTLNKSVSINKSFDKIEKKFDNILKSVELRKGRHYLAPGQQAPKGASVQHGTRGGDFYEDAPQQQGEKKPEGKPGFSEHRNAEGKLTFPNSSGQSEQKPAQHQSASAPKEEWKKNPNVAGNEYNTRTGETRQTLESGQEIDPNTREPRKPSTGVGGKNKVPMEHREEEQHKLVEDPSKIPKLNLDLNDNGNKIKTEIDQLKTRYDDYTTSDLQGAVSVMAEKNPGLDEDEVLSYIYYNDPKVFEEFKKTKNKSFDAFKSMDKKCNEIMKAVKIKKMRNLEKKADGIINKICSKKKKFK